MLNVTLQTLHTVPERKGDRGLRVRGNQGIIAPGQPALTSRQRDKVSTLGMSRP